MLENFLQNMAELCYFILYLYCVKIHALHFFLKNDALCRNMNVILV